jgi:hypothetical protein
VSDPQSNRELTTSERHLVQWMLEHGEPDARELLPQLDHARVTGWRCPCGCASLHFVVSGQPEPVGGLRPVADFLCGSGDQQSGIFLYEQSGVLAGIEVYGLAGDAPRTLPTPDMLHAFSDATRNA